MGIGYFSPEIAQSPLFQTYKTIKQMEKQGKDRTEINKALKEKFSDQKPQDKGGCWYGYHKRNETKELLENHPQLKEKLTEINPKFKMMNGF